MKSCRYPKKIFHLLCLLLLPLPLYSGESGGRAGRQLTPQQQMEQAIGTRTVPTDQLRAIRYNLHPSAEGKNQFRRRSVGLPNEPILNGGLGNGGSGSYFCGGGDEAFAYFSLGNLRTDISYRGTGNQGTYNSILREDICRTEGTCGTIQPDNKCFLFSLPTHATNCCPLGQMKAWDALSYEIRQELPASHDGWQGRNYIDDQYGFLFGRYLIDQVDCPPLTASSNPVAPLMDRTPSAVSADQYSPMRQSRPFLDIPYSLNHLKWGFTCGVLAGREAYAENRLFRTFWGGSGEGDGEPMGSQHKDHYKTLLTMATNRLCKEIGDGTFGNMTYPEGTTEREMREVVVPLCHILRTMIDRIPGDCAGQGCSTLRLWANALQGKLVDLREGGTARGTFIEFRPEHSAIFLEHAVYRDCQSKRPSNSHPHYNIEGSTGGRCRPSYGEWVDGGLYEPLYGTVPGRELYYEDVASGRRIRSRVGGKVPAAGYSPVVIARLAHELIHAYHYQEYGKTLDGWPLLPEAVDEEVTAVLGQSLTYYYLCDLGFCPKSFGMEKREFVRSYNRSRDSFFGQSSPDATRGLRFQYPSECRGYEGIYLGPFCNNMFQIAKWLGVISAQDRKPEIARMLALWHAQASTVDLPPFRTVDGLESPFEYLPMHGPRDDSRIITREQLIDESARQPRGRFQRMEK